jgi:hypothetical protein
MLLYNASKTPDARLNVLSNCNKAAAGLSGAWLQAVFMTG